MTPRMNFKVLSYNIHKGFTATNLKFVLEQMKRSIEVVGADLVFLQEVVGHHEEHGEKLKDWPTTAQFEYLADKIWPHHAYGKNAVYTQGHHGNAILSRYPIRFYENQDISPSRIERRGLLHAIVDAPGVSALHLICVHLGLFESDRNVQIQQIGDRISKMVPKDEPVIVAGDFNDWREKASPLMGKQIGLREAFFEKNGEHAKTFPSWMPFLRLDRIYYRGVECRTASLAEGAVWRDLSDHLPVMAEFQSSSKS